MSSISFSKAIAGLSRYSIPKLREAVAEVTAESGDLNPGFAEFLLALGELALVPLRAGGGVGQAAVEGPQLFLVLSAGVRPRRVVAVRCRRDVAGEPGGAVQDR